MSSTPHTSRTKDLRRHRWHYRPPWRYLPPEVHNPPEWDVQSNVAGYLDLHPACKDRWCHADGASRRDMKQRYWAKRLGLKAGIPDVMIFAPPFIEGRIWGGLALELKRCHKGSLTPGQRRWLQVYDDLGWYAVVARGSEAARELLDLAYPFDLPAMLPLGASRARKLEAAQELLALVREDGSRVSASEVALRCCLTKRDALRLARRETP